MRRLLPLAGMEKLLKKAGAPRVAEPAKIELREVLEEYAERIGVKALRFSQHSGRKTIKASDIKLAAKEV
ncbi:histone [archaeon]|nr:histone [archaeon]